MTDTIHSQPLTLPSDQDATGRSFGPEELEALRRVLESGCLTSTKGAAVKELERRFAELMGARHAFACASGTAAIHTAVAALPELEPGDEVITSAVTDMGALAPIVYQGGIPVFADVDPRTCNVTADSVAARVSERTRAVVVTHLFGNPCDMDGILDVTRRHGLRLIEDCAQAFGARSQGRLVGTLGDIGCFSLQQGKHITCGEGGLVLTNDDALARRMFLYINKAWGYGDPNPDHYFLALNYRMSELQGAVSLGQLDKLDRLVAQRLAMAERLTERLAGLPHLQTPVVKPGDVHTFWKYAVNVDPTRVEGGAVALGHRLRDRGIPSAPRYIQKPAFRCQVFAEQQTFGRSRWPFTLARPEAVDYARERFPGTFAGLEQLLVLPINERYTEAHVDHVATSITDACGI